MKNQLKLSKALDVIGPCGFNSHGYWADFKRIYELEVIDRGNEFPDIDIDPGIQCIWVCRRPRNAMRFLLPPEKYNNMTEEEIVAEMYRLVKIEFTKRDMVLFDTGEDEYLIARMEDE